MKPHLIAAVAGVLLVPASHNLVSIQIVDQIRRTTFSFKRSSSQVEITMLQNGEEGAGMPEMEREESKSRKGVFIDKTIAVRDDQLGEFEREYLDLSHTLSLSMSDPMRGEHSEEGVESSALEGVRINFVRKDGKFVASLPKGQVAEDDLLAGLFAELPWSEFLPEGGVEIGSQWEVAPEALWHALHLGGELVFKQEEKEGGIPRVKAATGLEAVKLDGSIKATLAQTEEVDGVSHARITLQIECGSLEDLTEQIAEMENETPDDAPPGMVVPDVESMSLETSYEGEGSMLWNLEGNYLASLQLELQTEEIQTILMVIEMGSESMEIEQAMISEGEQVLEVEVEVTRE